MKVVVLRETLPQEARVALVPESVKKLVTLKANVIVEAGAGLGASITDDRYREAGAEISKDREALLESADLLAVVNRPAPNDIHQLRKGSVLIGFLKPLDEPEAFTHAVAQHLTTFAVELIPRTTRAQAMDALSSMATVAGYKAVVVGSNFIPRMFPLLMTAAGTIPPAKVLVLGAGVAGLQAIATARRLGAVVEAYDVRAAAGEQVRSLGATFLEVDLGGIKTEDVGGYAVELSEEAMNRGRALIAERAKVADVVITLAASTGGNCAVSQPDETVERNGVTILAPTNLAATVPVHASQMYSRNVTAFLALLIKDGELNIDLNDDVVGPSCVTHQGKIVNQRVEAAMVASSPG
jgi:NAD(P) transhydrogenase subunit alpha